MIKRLFLLGVATMSIFFVGCSQNKIVYAMATSEFTYEQDSVSNGDSVFSVEPQQVTLTTFEFKESKEPIKFFIIFSGLTPWIKSFESMDLELFQKNEKGEFVKIENKKLDEFTADYFNGKIQIKTPLKNKYIYDQINWREVEWSEYIVNRDIKFSGMYAFDLKECPNELLLKFKMKWKEKEKSFETTLTRSDYVGPKFNPKF